MAINRDMAINNILQLPFEILEKILNCCDKKSLVCFACCGSHCNDLLAQMIFEDISIKWEKIQDAQNLLSEEHLQFTKRLSFEGPWCENSGTLEQLLQNFTYLISCCSALKLKDFSIMDGYQSLQDEDLIMVFKKCVNLKKVVLCNVNITSITFVYLSHLKFLKTLALQNCFVSDASFRNLVDLIDLSIEGCCWVSDSSLDYTTQIHGLKRLVLSDNYKADGNLENFEQHEPASFPMVKLKDLILLEYLDLSNTEISNQEELVSIITALKSLKEFYFSVLTLTYSINKICDLPFLMKLSLTYCSISDEQVPSFIKLKILCYLDISCNDITDFGLVHISQMVSLKELNISDNGIITDEGIKHLSSLNLESLDISYSNFTDIGLRHISSMVSLKNLNISGNYDITDSGIKHLVSLSQLSDINIRNCYDITSSALVYFSTLPSLKRLNVTGTKVSEEYEIMRILGKEWKYDD